MLLRGVASSGKTAHALTLAAAGYERLSIDEEVWARFGRYGIDYHSDTYAELSDLIEDLLRQRPVTLITEVRAVVVDFSFWRRNGRDRYKQLVEAAGGRSTSRSHPRCCAGASTSAATASTPTPPSPSTKPCRPATSATRGLRR